jgi:uncharacterized membrane protein YidH (DUF202 family)
MAEHPMLNFILYLAIFCPTMLIVIFIALKVYWKKDDIAYSEKMNPENYTMRCRKSDRAICFSGLFYSIAFIFLPVTLPEFSATDFLLSFPVGCLFAAYPLILLYTSIKWEVVITGDTIVINTPFRGSRTLHFDEIEYVIEDNYSMQASRSRYITYQIFAKNEQGKTVKAFSVMKNIHGYEFFALKIATTGKIDKEESERREREYKYLLIYWIFTALALFTVICALVILIIEIVSNDQISRLIITNTIGLVLMALIVYAIALICKAIGKKKAGKKKRS